MALLIFRVNQRIHKGVEVLKQLLFLVLIFVSSCNTSKVSQYSTVFSVDQLFENSEHVLQIADVRGEIFNEYHGVRLCNPEGSLCIPVASHENVYLPDDSLKPNFELEEDYLYKMYKDLSIKIGDVQRRLGNARLFATLRGRFERYTYSDDGKEVLIDPKMVFDPVEDFEFITRIRGIRFVLQKVLELDIRPGSGKLDPWLSNDPADLEELLRGNDKDK